MIIQQIPVIHKLSELLGKDVLPLLMTCKRGTEYLTKDYYVLTNMYEDSWDVACERKDLKWIKFMCANKIPDDNVAMCHAFYYGSLEIIKYLYSVGKQIDNDCMSWLTMRNASGRYEFLKFLHDVGKEIPNSVADYMASNGYLKEAKFLHSIGNIFSIEAINQASYNGHFETVKFLYSVGVDSYQCMNLATRGGSLDIVKFFYENGKYKNNIFTTALNCGRYEIIKFLLDKEGDNIKIPFEILYNLGRYDKIKNLFHLGVDCSEAWKIAYDKNDLSALECFNEMGLNKMYFTLEKIFKDFESTETWILEFDDCHDIMATFALYNKSPLVYDTQLAIVPIDDRIDVMILGDGKNEILELDRVLRIVDFFRVLFHSSTSKECLIKDVWGIDTK